MDSSHRVSRRPLIDIRHHDGCGNPEQPSDTFHPRVVCSTQAWISQARAVAAALRHAM
jgi:hypothetical protein